MRALSRTQWIALGGASAVGVAVVSLAPRARSSDHQDGPQARLDPAADIADVFAWMSSDGAKAYLVMDVFPFAPATAGAAKFSTTAQYVFHTQSRPSLTAPAASSTDVICTFDAAQAISCWVGAADYVSGDASATQGIASASGKVRVFAGLRNDPAFWNKKGFTAFGAYVHGNFGAIAVDPAGCRALSTTQSTTMVNLLKSDGQGGPPADAFAKTNVLSIVLAVDKALLTTPGAAVLGVWASTRRP